MKTLAGRRKLRYVGLQRNRGWLLITGAAYKPHPHHRPGRPGRLIRASDRPSAGAKAREISTTATLFPTSATA